MIKKIFFILCIFTVFFLSLRIDAYEYAFLSSKGINPNDIDISQKALGQFTKILSSISFTNADIYFHGGVYDQEEHENKSMFHDIDKPKSIPLNNSPFFVRLFDSVHVMEHRHLSGKEYKELLPWIYYAVKLNPNNIQAYNIGGYWLIYQMGMPEQGIKFLKEGIRNNPQSWQLYATLGTFYFTKENYEKSIFYLERAKSLGNTFNIDNYSKRFIYTPLAETYIQTGRKTKAIDLYLELEEIFPDDPAIKSKIKEYQVENR